MYYFIQAIAAWAAGFFLIDWRRFRSLMPYVLLGSYVTLLQDRFGEHLHLWHYRDFGPILDANAEISILISLSAAPIAAVLFVQGLRPGASWPWKRILAFTAIGMAPEVAAMLTGRIEYGRWWGAGYSFIAYIVLWTAFWGFWRWLECARSGDTTR